MSLAPGSRLGAYEVLSALGAGGMGEVFRARDTRLGREVAIKILPADRLADAQRRRRFVKEAQALPALNHPHIVTIHELESAGEIDFIVTELVRGATLDVLIPKHGLRVGDLLLYAIPIADALAAAHARGIIHRDLKPANIMLSDEGSVKVLDFGIAKLMGEDEAPATEGATHRRTATATAAGRIAGTPAYMAPEQLGGHVDARTDIFSFGAVLYEMATGQCAFGRDSHDATLAAVLEAQPRPPSRIVRGMPRELERLILRCLRKDAARRYQTMLDVRNELLELTEASRSASALPKRWQRQRPLIAAAAIALIVLVVASLSWWRNRGDNPAPRVVPLTTLEGWERMPTFSPDGEQVPHSIMRPVSRDAIPTSTSRSRAAMPSGD
jgi:eukaryotic-like serine/threonine-protein kinase